MWQTPLRELSLSLEENGGRRSMVAYQFYVIDDQDEFHLLGVLPERRENSSRISRESIIKWGKSVVGDSVSANHLYFIQVEL